ncbi:MAG TPA: GNAT family N-acetyltransferase [Candidatus Limnocylindrales bacterium]
MADLLVRAMTPADAEAVRAIYQAGLDGGLASFETVAPGWAAFDRGKLADHRLVAEAGGSVVGWVAVSAVSARPVYAGVVEHSVYVCPSARGRGAGSALLRALFASTEAAGIWTIQSGIFPANTASVRLHTKAGFRIVGTREKVGRHPLDGWRDVLMIERRSDLI